MFAYIWEFFVDENNREKFLRYYGPNGDWVALFRNGQGYIESELLEDQENPQRFLTIDYWESKADRDAFRRRYAREFEMLDQACEAFTRTEKLIGEFSFHKRRPK